MQDMVSPHGLIAAPLIMQRLRRPRAHLSVELLPDVDQEQQTPQEAAGRQREPPLNVSLLSRSYQREPINALKQVNRCPAGDPDVHRCFHAAGCFSPSLHHCMSLEFPPLSNPHTPTFTFYLRSCNEEIFD